MFTCKRQCNSENFNWNMKNDQRGQRWKMHSRFFMKCVFKDRKTNISEDIVEKEKYMENGD